MKRILSLFLVFLSFLSIVLFSSCEIANTKEETVRKIYLSPSKQPANPYAVGETNEEAEMEDLAQYVFDLLLEEYEVEVKMADLTLENHLATRSEEAETWGADLYLALHSNAASGKAAGSTGFYHPKDKTGKTLCRNITSRLDAVCPITSTVSRPVKDGMAAVSGGYAEIRNPHNHGMVAALIEVNFHDNPETATYILEQKIDIAKAIVEGVAETYQLPKKGAETTE